MAKNPSEIFFTREIGTKLPELAEGRNKVFLMMEDTVGRFCYPRIREFVETRGVKVFSIPAGEENKKLESVAAIWEFLSNNGADRKSLQINLGGGMLTDLAGFAATTFKRGIDFVNIPTTLLSQVDASVGGKTGINFNGLKNEIGTFREPNAVVINVDFLRTIDRENFISGYAEMIKHGLIHSTAHLSELEDFDLRMPDYTQLERIIRHSVEVKQYFVENDPTEKNIRKALNFGHTIGHAIESFAMRHNKPILHGYAVAYGMIAELFLSAKKAGFDKGDLKEITQWLELLYGKFIIRQSNYAELFDLMTHDKKNESGRINFTLIPAPGQVLIDQVCTKEEIFEALDYYMAV